MSWQSILANAITDPQELLTLLQLDPALLAAARQATKLFPLKVPHSFLARMQVGDITDPLLRQVLPLDAELQEVAGYSADPLAEQAVNPIPGLLHKYHGRVLLTVVGACGINCRYCFRREFPYAANTPGRQGWERVISYIAARPEVKEVILSGGDPLVAPDHYLAGLIAKLAAIPHVKTLRIHSRLPIVIPERITSELITLLTGSRLRPVMVVHCNHPQELDSTVSARLHALRQAGIMLFNQAVLLRGVNDAAPILAQLSEELFAAGVLPYYLHLLDPVRGTAHFAVAEAAAQALMAQLYKLLPGYLVPRLVQEKPGMASKLPINCRF